MADAPAFDPTQPFKVAPSPQSQDATPSFDASKPFTSATDSNAAEPITDYSRSSIKLGEVPTVMDSFGTGLGTGLGQIVGNADRASASLLKKVGVDTGGTERYAKWRQSRQRPDIAAALDTGAGEAGKITGDILGTAPLALATENPLALGAGAGAMTTEKDTLGGATVDTGLGAAGGKLGDVALRGLGSVASNVVNRYAPNVVMASGPAAPKAAQKAVDYVTRLLDSSGVTPSDLVVAGANTTKPLTAAEVIGKNGTTALGALARREGETADVLDGILRQRAIDAPGRMLDDYATASGIDPRLAKGDIDGYVTSGRTTVKPMFDQALGTANGAQSPAVWNSQLATLAQRKPIQRAMSAVVDDLDAAGKDATAFGFIGQNPATGKFIKMPRPTAEAWDMVKKRVSSLAERDQFGRILPDSVSPGNYNLNVAGRDLTSALRNSIPGYGDALDASGDYLSLKQAFEDGQNFILNPKMSPQQVAKHVASLSAPEQEAFKGGIANNLFEKAQNGNLSGRYFFTAKNGAIAPIPAVAQKLELALGRDNAQGFVENLGREGQMAAASTRMRPGINSPTAEYNEAMRQQDAGFGLPDEMANIATDLIRNPSLKGAAMGSAARLGSKAIAAYQTKGMPVEVRNEAGRLLMMHPTDLGRYLNRISVAQAQQPAVGQIANATAHGAAAPWAGLLSGPVAAAGFDSATQGGN